MTIDRPIGRPAAVLALVGALVASGATRAQLGLDGAQFLQQGVGGIPDVSEELDELGRALAAGDFDGDGYDDLAIAAPGETVFAGVTSAGQVTIVYGTGTGLDPASGAAWSIDWTAHGPGVWGDQLGSALAVGDFDDDGYDDLALGIPYRNVPSGGDTAYDGGAVLVLYGSESGLGAAGSELWHQGAGNVEGVAESDDELGSALAAGDFNGDGFADLAIGVPGEDVGAVQDAGAVNVIYGSPSGLSTTFAAVQDQIWVEGDLGLPTSETGDGFGASLAAGDFDGDGRDDLVIGTPREDIGGIEDAGVVYVLLGTGLGLSAVDYELVSQFDANPPEAEEEDWFGSSVLAADVDGDGRDDLVVGSIYEDIESPAIVASAGAVHIVRGSATGLEESVAWIVRRSDTSSSPAGFDHFGAALAAGRFDGGGTLDFVAGAFGVDVDGQSNAGAAFVFAGRAAAAPLFQIELSQAGTVSGAVEVDDHFASALAVGDFDGNGFDDLAAGVPGESAGGAEDGGAVNVFHSAGLFRDGFESGDTARWSSAVAN